MIFLRVVDQAGNKIDHETEFVPRIGERIELSSESVRPHYFRVKDVAYKLDNKPEHQASILVEEESNPEHWPS
jgi:hypothetical protein